MEFVIEFFLELYLDLATEWLPERKLSKGKTILLKLLSILTCLGVIALIIVGAVMISDGHPVWGGILLGLGIAILAVQVGLFIYLIVKDIKRSRGV